MFSWALCCQFSIGEWPPFLCQSRKTNAQCARAYHRISPGPLHSSEGGVPVLRYLCRRLRRSVAPCSVFSILLVHVERGPAIPNSHYKCLPKSPPFPLARKASSGSPSLLLVSLPCPLPQPWHVPSSPWPQLRLSRALPPQGQWPPPPPPCRTR